MVPRKITILLSGAEALTRKCSKKRKKKQNEMKLPMHKQQKEQNIGVVLENVREENSNRKTKVGLVQKQQPPQQHACQFHQPCDAFVSRLISLFSDTILFNTFSKANQSLALYWCTTPLAGAAENAQ